MSSPVRRSFMPSSDAIGDYYPPRSPDFPELKRSTDAPGVGNPRTPPNTPIWIQPPAPGESPAPSQPIDIPATDTTESMTIATEDQLPPPRFPTRNNEYSFTGYD